jgi:hypothetical protein
MLPGVDRLIGLAIVLAAFGWGCGGRGEKRFGERCYNDVECARGLCVAGARGDHAICTKSCARASDCPEGWSCSGVTADNVLVCAHGSATPFGQ